MSAVLAGTSQAASRTGFLSIAVPSGTTAGAVMFAAVTWTGGPFALTAPSGWTTIGSAYGDVSGVSIALYYRVATSSEPASYAWSGVSGSTPMVGGIESWKGLDTSTSPVDAYAIGSMTASTSVVAPSVTTDQGCLVVRAFAAYAQSTTITAPSSTIQRLAVNGGGSLTLSDSTSGVGATGTSTATASTRDNVVGATVAFKVINTAPNAPAITSPANGQVLDRNITQRIVVPLNDPDPGDSQSRLDLRIWDLDASGARVGAAHTYSSVSPNQFYDLAAGTLTAGRKEIQALDYDSQGVAAVAWSASVFFTAADAPPAPTITDPINGATIGLSTYTAVISAPDVVASRWRTVADNAGAADPSTIYQDSGIVTTGDLRRHTFTFPVNNRTEHLQSQIQNAAGLWSTWADSRNPISYTPPTTPTWTGTAINTLGTPTGTDALTVTITNPAPGTGQPATAYNDVYVTDPGEAEERRATGLPTNTTWIYRTPPSGFDGVTVGKVRVVAVATNGTTASSG